MNTILWSLSGLITVYLIFRINGFFLRKRIYRNFRENGVPKPTDKFEIVSLTNQTRTFKCGHEGPREYVVHIFGENVIPPEKILNQKEICPQCRVDNIKSTTIRCALCGLSIMPNDAVALYAKSTAFKKEWTTLVNHSVVGCLRWKCCPSGGFFAGHWSRNGFLPTFEGKTIAESAIEIGGTVIVSDATNSSSTTTTSTPQKGNDHE